MTHVDLRRVFAIRPTRPGVRWLLGIALLATLLGAFWASGVFDVQGRGATGASYGAALFFSAIVAYIVAVFGYIGERTGAALDVLHDQLDAPSERIAQWRARVDRKPLRWLASVLAIGSLSGIAHNLVLSGSPQGVLREVTGSTAELSIVLGTELTWIVVTLVVAALLDNAVVLARAAAHCRVDLLDTGKLRPFATVAVISTLAIIGAQALFPVMSIEAGLDPMAYIPGLFATGVPMLLLAALPVWPVHRRIAAARRLALRQVNARIASLPAPDPEVPETLADLTPLLGYRRELQSVSEWPFDVGVVTRLGLYLIIPPLTWVGAALIERALETVL